MAKENRYKSVVFAGGGSRCFWQLGFWEAVAGPLSIRPDFAASVSAGAAFACFALAADGRSVLNHFKKLTSANKKNFYPGNLFSRTSMFPHNVMYSEALNHNLDEKTIAKLNKTADVQVLITRAPSLLGSRTAAFISVAAYNIEKHVFYPLHPRFSTRLGFKGEIVSIRECPDKKSLVDLILQSSCAPPLLPVMKRDNRVVLDGGIIDNVPVFMVKDRPGDKLVLLTRRYKAEMLAGPDDITFVQPSEDIKITKWEYSDPEGLQYVYDLGRRDGDLFVKEYRK